MSKKYVRLNVDVPTTKISLKRGMEWPLNEAPDLVKRFAGQNKKKIMHTLNGVDPICIIFTKDEIEMPADDTVKKLDLTDDPPIVFSDEDFADI